MSLSSLSLSENAPEIETVSFTAFSRTVMVEIGFKANVGAASSVTTNKNASSTDSEPSVPLMITFAEPNEYGSISKTSKLLFPAEIVAEAKG